MSGQFCMWASELVEEARKKIDRDRKANHNLGGKRIEYESSESR